MLLKASKVLKQSSEGRNSLITELPFAIEESIIALCVIDLSPGTLIVPPNPLAFPIFLSIPSPSLPLICEAPFLHWSAEHLLRSEGSFSSLPLTMRSPHQKSKCTENLGNTRTSRSILRSGRSKVAMHSQRLCERSCDEVGCLSRY